MTTEGTPFLGLDDIQAGVSPSGLSLMSRPISCSASMTCAPDAKCCGGYFRKSRHEKPFACRNRGEGRSVGVYSDLGFDHTIVLRRNDAPWACFIRGMCFMLKDTEKNSPTGISTDEVTLC